jgi:type IV pilus assembly protein PilE
MKNSRGRGFTLIELMIVVAVIAILASIAYPSYRDSILKGRRASARAALAELLQQQERYMTQQNTYLSFTNATGTTVPATASTTFKVYSGDSGGNPDYWLSATTCTVGAITDCVVVVATPVQSDPEVDVLSISSTGAKACTGTASSTNPKLCWP